MEATAAYGFFADRYGWTFRQTLDENPEWYLERLPAYAAVLDEVRAEKAKAAAR